MWHFLRLLSFNCLQLPKFCNSSLCETVHYYYDDKIKRCGNRANASQCFSLKLGKLFFLMTALSTKDACSISMTEINEQGEVPGDCLVTALLFLAHN